MARWGTYLCRSGRGTWPWVAEELHKRWGSPGAWLVPSPQEMAQVECGDTALEDTADLAPTTDPDNADGDSTGLLHMWMVPVVGTMAAREEEPEQSREDFFEVAQRVVAYLEGTGTPLTVTASALMELIWARGEHDYLMEAEAYFLRMNLPIDVDRCRAVEVGAEAQTVIAWMEAELWQEFIDFLEGMVGESEQVMQARDQRTMEEDARTSGGNGRRCVSLRPDSAPGQGAEAEAVNLMPPP